MARIETLDIPTGRVKVAFTDRSDGNFALGAPQAELASTRRRVVAAPWTWLRQVHEANIVIVDRPGQWAGTEADGAVTSTIGCPLAVMTADCAPVVLVSETAVGVVHAGWRGLAAGIIEHAADQLEGFGGAPLYSLLGPCINADAYEFGAEELACMVERYGPEVEGLTAWGTPALDVPTAVVEACRRAGWPEPETTAGCTSEDRWFSHRSRVDVGRQATVAWLEPADGLGPSPADKPRR